MSQAIEDNVKLFCVRCVDVGLDCNYVIFGISEENAMENTLTHMFDYHAIYVDPEEMTMYMKLKMLIMRN
jgi:predicted small metal-binding protein